MHKKRLPLRLSRERSAEDIAGVFTLRELLVMDLLRARVKESTTGVGLDVA